MALFEIVHEDPDLLVINKPADLVCHPTKTDAMSSLIGRVRLYLEHAAGCQPAQQPSATRRYDGKSSGNGPHLVNRLDRETSGLVLVAKTAAAALELRRLMEDRQVQKEYLAIVHGAVPDQSGVIDAPLGKDERSPVAIKSCVRPDGAPSITEYRLVKHFERIGKIFSLLRVRPLMGRKHQIRVHLQFFGHSVVGDKIYGGEEGIYLAFVRGEMTAEQREKMILPNQALHAERLRFTWRGKDWDLRADPEEWFKEFCGL